MSTNYGRFTNVTYTTDGKANIDFSSPISKGTSWKNPVMLGTAVKLQTGATRMGYGILNNGVETKLFKAGRSRHNMIANRLRPDLVGAAARHPHLAPPYEGVRDGAGRLHRPPQARPQRRLPVLARRAMSSDLGEFRFNSDLDRHESTVEMDGAQVPIRVASEVFGDRAKLNEVIGVVERDRKHLLGQVTADLLEDKNEEWLQDDEEPLSEEEFRHQLSLEAVEIGPGGDVELLFADDGMFWGHQIVMNLDSDYHLARVNLEG